jgi:predicted phage tail protein
LRTQRFGSLTIAGRAVFIGQSQGATVITAPGSPRQLAVSVTAASVTLSWSAPEGGGPASSYVLAAGTASGLSNVANVVTGNTATTFTATGVPSGRYFVRVSARNTAGTSTASNEVSFTVGEASCAAAPPSAPQFTVIGSLVTLSWSPPVGAAPRSYLIEAGTGPSLSNVASVDTGSTSTSFSANATPGIYYLRVRAFTPCGISAPTADLVVTLQP